MIGHYKRSKFLAERAVLDAARAGLPVVIVNPSTPVGPGDVKPTPTGQVVLDAACGRMPAYVDTGLNIVHVDDVARGHLLAFERGVAGERYILGGKDMTLREILAEIARLVGRDPPRVRLPYAAVLPIAYIAEAFSRRVRARGPHHPGGRAHVAQAHVLLERQGAARARLCMAAAGRRRSQMRCNGFASAGSFRVDDIAAERAAAFDGLRDQQNGHAEGYVPRPLQQGNRESEFGARRLRAVREAHRTLPERRVRSERELRHCALRRQRPRPRSSDKGSTCAPISRKAIHVPAPLAIQAAKCTAHETATRERLA